MLTIEFIRKKRYMFQAMFGSLEAKKQIKQGAQVKLFNMYLIIVSLCSIW